MAFSLIGVYIHPTVLQTTSADGIYIFLAQGCQAFTDQIDAFFIWHFNFLLDDWRPHIIIGEFLEAKRLAFDLKIAVPDRKIFLEGVDQVIKNISWDVQVKERGR